MSYNPPDYWARRGRTHEAEARREGWWNAENQQLMDLLSTLEFRSVFDVGCGFGRVGTSILSRWPDVAYTGLDVSEDLVAGARRNLPDGTELISADLATFETDRTWDLVLAVSVLGHLLPSDVDTVIGRMRRWATRDLVAIDWNEVGGQTSFQFGHDYAALYGDAVRSVTPLGRTSMWHVDPERRP